MAQMEDLAAVARSLGETCQRSLRRPLSPPTRTPAAGVAVVIAKGDDQQIAMVSGRDPLTDASLFDVGSITKTLVATLLADMVERGEVKLTTTVADLVEASTGPCGPVTLEELATHTSGLPRLPPNLRVGPLTVKDPYAAYGEDQLVAALALTPIASGHGVVYSNYGFMLLGYLLGRAAKRSLSELLAERVFAPLGMDSAVCSAPSTAGRLPGYRNGRSVPHWSTPLPGAGGVEATIGDVAAYLRASIYPDDTPLAKAIAATHEPRHGDGAGRMLGLGWVCDGDLRWHNGGTGGFRAFVGFDAAARSGVAVLANDGNASRIDAIAVRELKSGDGTDTK